VTLRAPFPWFGGKSRVAHIVWPRLGDVRNYVEPFAGSLAVLLARPTDARVETVNDANAYLANFWRALAGENADPDAVAFYADSPVNEADLHARHRWLVETAHDRAERVMSDPDYFDPKVAGWWVWGQCLWIGSGWCQRPDWKGRAHGGRSARGLHANGTNADYIVDWRQRPDLSSPNGRGDTATGKPARRPQKLRADGGAGRTGVLSDRVQKSAEPHGLVGIEAQHKKRPVLSHGGGRRVLRHGEHDDAVKVSSERPLLTGNGEGCGVTKVSLTRQIDDLAGDSGAVGRGIVASGFDLRTGGVYAYMHALATRLRRVRVCCGDWSRVVTPAVTTCIATTAVFLDPPYHAPGTERSAVYTHDTDTIWRETRDWAVANGDNPELRIALCGYEGDHEIPDSWECVEWKASGGYGRSARGRANRDRERIWFSPHCLSANAVQHSLDLDGVVA
jgi:Fe-S cluster biogenesis protein NfuA